MKKMMKEYIGKEYTSNHLKNFCLYWMKAAKGKGDEWRKENDLDCLYFDGDLLADTLMSAWTPIKWVVDYLNKERNMKFYKRAADHEDPDHYLKLLAEDCDAFLPPKHELVQLLNRFLALAEERCNFILLPDRNMNPARYKSIICGKEVWLCDEVPATLFHIFEKNSLGKYFLNQNGEVDTEMVTSWIEREHLEMGFEKCVIGQENILPFISNLNPGIAKWLTEENEIKEALNYMIRFLKDRQQKLSESYDK